MRLTIPVGSAQGALRPEEFLGSGIPLVRGCRASKGGENPRVVLGRPEVFTVKGFLGLGTLREQLS